jgi:hypothetical protein
VATQIGRPINLGNAGLISAAGRRLTAPYEDEQQVAVGQEAPGPTAFNGFNVAPNVAPEAAAPSNAQLKQFSFNPKYSNLAAGLDRNVADAGFQRQNAIFQTNDVYNTQLTDAQKAQQEAIRKLEQSLWSRGMGSSSAMLVKRGEQESNYQRYIDNLNRIRAGGLAQAEQGYGRAIEDVNRQREGIYFNQVQEEEELARQRAREAAEQAARQEAIRLQQEHQAAMQAQAHQQWVDSQNAAAAQADRQARLLASLGGGGGGGGGWNVGGGGGGGAPAPPNNAIYGLPNGQMVNADTFLSAVQGSPDQNWLNYLWDKELGLPSNIRQAVLGRIAPNRGWGGGNIAAL